MNELCIVEMPYPGHIQSLVYTDDQGVQRVQFSGSLYGNGSDDLTPDEYNKARGINAVVMSLADATALALEHMRAQVTDPEVISESDHDEWLNCLPPERWHTVNGWSVFHICERLNGELVQWCGSRVRGDALECVGWVDFSYVSDKAIAAKLDKVGS